MEISGKAGQRQSYRGASSLCSMRCYSYGELWSAMVHLGCFVAKTRGVMFATAGYNVAGFLSGGGEHLPPLGSLSPPLGTGSAVHVERAMPPHQISYCRFAPPPLAQILKETLCSLCEGPLLPVRSQMREGWPSQTGVYTLFGVFRGQSHVYYKSVRDCSKCSVFLRIM